MSAFYEVRSLLGDAHIERSAYKACRVADWHGVVEEPVDIGFGILCQAPWLSAEWRLPTLQHLQRMMTAQSNFNLASGHENWFIKNRLNVLDSPPSNGCISHSSLTHSSIYKFRKVSWNKTKTTEAFARRDCMSTEKSLDSSLSKPVLQCLSTPASHNHQTMINRTDAVGWQQSRKRLAQATNFWRMPGSDRPDDRKPHAQQRNLTAVTALHSSTNCLTCLYWHKSSCSAPLICLF